MTLTVGIPPSPYYLGDELSLAARRYRVETRDRLAQHRRLPGVTTVQLVSPVDGVIEGVCDALRFSGLIRGVAVATLDVDAAREDVLVDVSVML